MARPTDFRSAGSITHKVSSSPFSAVASSFVFTVSANSNAQFPTKRIHSSRSRWAAAAIKAVSNSCRGLDGLAHSVRDKEVDEEFLRLAKENGVTQLTTLAGHHGRFTYADGPTFLDDPGLAVLFPASVLETVGSKEYQQEAAKRPGMATSRKEYANAAKNAATVAAAGIPIAVGTDSGSPGHFPGLWEHREMELMVDAGLTPMQAIQAATINGAKFLGVDDRYGTLEPGKVADMIVLDADPLDDITNSRKIDSVWMNGKQVNRDSLAPHGHGSN